jgi:hypothetical protein
MCTFKKKMYLPRQSFKIWWKSFDTFQANVFFNGDLYKKFHMFTKSRIYLEIIMYITIDILL